MSLSRSESIRDQSARRGNPLKGLATPSEVSTGPALRLFLVTRCADLRSHGLFPGILIKFIKLIGSKGKVARYRVQMKVILILDN